MLFPMHFFESRAYEQSAPPPAAVSFHVIFFLCIWWQDTGGWLEAVLNPLVKNLTYKEIYKSGYRVCYLHFREQDYV